MNPHVPRSHVRPSRSHKGKHAPSAPEVSHSRHSLPPAWWTAATLVGALLATAALLVGCASTSGIAGPSHKMTALGAAGATAADTPWPKADWWKNWGDAQLDALIDTALAKQPNVQIVQARLVQAQAAIDVADAAQGPQVNGSLDLTHQRFTENGLYPPPLAGSTRWSNEARIGASWELDFFGKHAATIAAAVGELRAAQANAQAARVLLAGNVASGYANLARLIDARALARQALEQREQTLTLVQQRIDAGLDTNVEVRQAEGFIAQTRVELEALEESIARSRHALAELSGQRPDALDALTPRLAQVRAMPLPAGLPADLLGRRADLVAQRWRVEAAVKDVDLARAQFYPNVNLLAFVGLSSLGLDKFADSGSVTYGAGPALRLPIFQGSRLRANLRSKNAEVDAAVEGYNAALLRALREVADEASTLQSLQRQQQAQDQASSSAEAAYDLATQRYRAGLGNYLVVLTAQTNVLAQRRASAELKARHLVAEAALARALGGGYQADAGAAATLVGAAAPVASPR